MKIGIDARLWQETGVGRYIRALVTELILLDKKNQYALFLKRPQYESLDLPDHWQKVLTDVHWHTFEEQIVMPKYYAKENLDLLHIPYFAVPILTKIPFVVTFHDLTISHFPTGKATTLPLPFYLIKRLGYDFLVKMAASRSRQIITVSESVKKDLIKTLKLSPEKITVTYEAGHLEQKSTGEFKKHPQKYILYVGNAHPHKNLEKLVDAFILIKNEMSDLKLVFIGKEDYFYKRLKEYVNFKKMSQDIIFMNEVKNSELANWYKNAEIFIFPSLSEGFGIPGLEAMSLGCVVAASSIPVFHEVYGDAAYFFDEEDEKMMGKSILDLLKNKPLQEALKKKGLIQVQKYSWKKMAEETLKVYESVV